MDIAYGDIIGVRDDHYWHFMQRKLHAKWVTRVLDVPAGTSDICINVTLGDPDLTLFRSAIMNMIMTYKKGLVMNPTPNQGIKQKRQLV